MPDDQVYNPRMATNSPELVSRRRQEGIDMSWRLHDAHYRLWQSLGWIIAGWALWQGVNYASAGYSRTNTPNFYVLVHDVPGGLRTYGWVMLSVAAFLIYELQSNTRARKIAVGTFCGFCVLVAVSQFGALLLTSTRRFDFAQPAAWLAFAGVSAAMIMFPPPPKGCGNV